MRYFVPFLFVILTACASGPGNACDPCAQNEANAVGPLSQAAAATALGGQEASQAPFVRGSPLAPQTVVGRGQGNVEATSQDREHREVASGAALNQGLLLPNQASAKTGGVAPAVQEAARTVATYRTALQVAMADPSTSDARLAFLSDQLAKAQSALAAASDASKVSQRYDFSNAYINQVGLSTSKTGSQPGIDPRNAEAIGRAASEIAGGRAGVESTSPADDDLGTPPAGAPEGP